MSKFNTTAVSPMPNIIDVRAVATLGSLFTTPAAVARAVNTVALLMIEHDCCGFEDVADDMRAMADDALDPAVELGTAASRLTAWIDEKVDAEFADDVFRLVTARFILAAIATARPGPR